MTLPNYFYGGPPKAGSSWIYALLESHPQVFVPDGKYVHFFSDYYDRGIDWYEQVYADAGPEIRARCDLTTDYLFLPEAAERLARHVPDARIFFSLRNPVERDWSAYQHLLRVGMARGPLETEIDTAHPMLSACSAYADAIERAWQLFGRENTHVLWFDDIRADPQGAADGLYDFLGVERRPIQPAEGEARNVARAARYQRLNGLLKRGAIAMRTAGLSPILGKMKENPLVDRLLFSAERVPRLKDAPEAWRFLAGRHAAEIDRLEALLSRDLSQWRRQP